MIFCRLWFQLPRASVYGPIQGAIFSTHAYHSSAEREGHIRLKMYSNSTWGTNSRHAWKSINAADWYMSAARNTSSNQFCLVHCLCARNHFFRIVRLKLTCLRRLRPELMAGKHNPNADIHRLASRLTGLPFDGNTIQTRRMSLPPSPTETMFCLIVKPKLECQELADGAKEGSLKTAKSPVSDNKMPNHIASFFENIKPPFLPKEVRRYCLSAHL
ncbi:unnamed protein product [Protopolystoma xenopodis]|uniref:Uncharacterized protein n=1 Tax=Protopolystoma xenopodis TaxID=117903 RepID=A0A448WXT4_9PLAT|nr:unnamed protein product [Protopolystoma xenopodis]